MFLAHSLSIPVNSFHVLEQYNKKARELLQNPNYSIKINLKKELDTMNIEINNTRNRKEHFTEYGMIPIKVNPIETIVEDKKPIVNKLKFPLVSAGKY